MQRGLSSLLTKGTVVAKVRWVVVGVGVVVVVVVVVVAVVAVVGVAQSAPPLVTHRHGPLGTERVGGGLASPRPLQVYPIVMKKRASGDTSELCSGTNTCAICWLDCCDVVSPWELVTLQVSSFI
ncbi:unnamed protein product [Arctogadus glacialis]